MSNISQRLDFRQSQNLVMTPQLQQAIKLLQLSNIELADMVEEELANNPLLEKVESDPADGPLEGEDVPAKESPESDSMTEAFEGAFEDETGREPQDFDAGSTMADIGAGGNSKFEDLNDEGFESRMAREKSLREHLTEQLFMSMEDGPDRLIGALLIDRLDEAGYLREDTENLAAGWGCTSVRVAHVLAKMKGFDPTGVFARDLPECLALQLEEQGLLDAPMRKLLAHLDILAHHDFEKLAGICDVNETYLQDMIADIRALNPRPAANFDHFVVQTAIPDVLMKRLPKNLGGGWRVELNTDTLPRVLVNQTYYTEVASTATQKKDKEYLNTQLQNAHWLVRAMDQRAQTILKVSAQIVEEQEGFFNYGIEFLRPLKLSDIAGIVGMHESTISRVTTNKYIGTPRGIFELKYFFSTALVSSSGVEHSAEAIKARIKTLIDAENPDKVLSDDKLVEILKVEGIDLARRTVAKYREGMHIPSTVQRRRQKKSR